MRRTTMTKLEELYAAWEAADEAAWEANYGVAYYAAEYAEYAADAAKAASAAYLTELEKQEETTDDI
jgi:hypothetical protein